MTDPATAPAVVFVVGMEPLDQGAEAQAAPEMCFTTREAAVAWGTERGQPKIGTHYWWGTLEDVDESYTVWEIEVRDVR